MIIMVPSIYIEEIKRKTVKKKREGRKKTIERSQEK